MAESGDDDAGRRALGTDGGPKRLAQAYVERVEELEGLRRRLDEIAELLAPYSDGSADQPLDPERLARILRLTRYTD